MRRTTPPKFNSLPLKIQWLEHYFLSYWVSVSFQRRAVKLRGGFKGFLFSPLFGEDFQFDDHIFQMGWFNHQPVNFGKGNAEFGAAFCKNIGLELGSIEVFIYSWPTIVLDRWQPEIPRPTTSWMYKIPANDGMNYQPQLVQDFFHQHYFVF